MEISSHEGTHPTELTEQQPTHKKSRVSAKLAVFLGIMLIIGAVLFTKEYLAKRPNQPGSFIPALTDTLRQSPYSLTTTRQWINCDDIRDVIEENNTLYVACLGGVLVIDKSNGKVIDQISMTDGLSNAVTNSLAKKDNILYIGTQDGFTIFDIETKIAKKISIQEGLISGSNIKLALDGDDLWVGSFEGLSRYSLLSGKIENFTTELVDNSTKYNASKILVTPKAIYAIALANAYTPGGVARLDKATKQWERFGPSSFLSSTNQYSRVDFFNIVQAGDKIYVAEDNMIWEGEDEKHTSWKRLESINSQLIPEDYGIRHLIGTTSKLFIIANSLMYEYSSSTSTIKRIYPQHDEGENLLGDGGLTSTHSRDEKIWISAAPWLRWIELNNLQTGTISLQKRPKNITSIIATIDSSPIVYADGQIWKYDLQKDEFQKIPGLKDYVGGITEAVSTSGTFAFQPLPETSKILIFSQVCGMGCSEPKFAFYDYAEGSIKPVEIPQDIMNKLSSGNVNGTPFYYGLVYKNFDYSTKKILLKADYKSQGLLFDPVSSSFEILENMESAEKENNNLQVSCNPAYEFTANNKKFKTPACIEELAKQQNTWKSETGFPKNRLWQINKQTQEKTELNPPLADEEYSAFGQQDQFSINKLLYDSNKLWIATNRGLVRYDPQEKSWKLITVKDGLVSNDVSNAVIDKSQVWVATHWGGFSGIPLK